MSGRVKLELRQENRESTPIQAEMSIRSQEPILNNADEYNVSLLKYTTGFDVPILHIDKEDELVFIVWISGGANGYIGMDTIEMSGTYYSIQDFCDDFNKQMYWNTQEIPAFVMTFDKETGKFTILPKFYGNMDTGALTFNEAAREMFKKQFRFIDSAIEEVKDPRMGWVLVDNLDQALLETNKPIEAITSDNYMFYNFDYIQLETNLPISQTLTSNSTNRDVIKISTLGTVQANASVEDAYVEGGLLYLPNFKISSSLVSDLPLYNFKIMPHIFYKTGYSQRVMLNPGSTSYALVEFEPKQ